MKTINIKGQDYNYEEQEFYLGMKKIDRKISRRNLIDLNNILVSNGIDLGLIYGTLLGAIREKDFIEHDQDTDIFILEEDKMSFVNCLFQLRDNGFELGRVDENHGLMSLMRNGEYIDVYIFKKSLLLYRKNGRQYIRKEHLEKREDLELFDNIFRIPYQPIKFIEKHYGKDWRIPIKDKPARSRYFIGRYKELVKKHILKRK